MKKKKNIAKPLHTKIFNNFLIRKCHVHCTLYTLCNNNNVWHILPISRHVYHKFFFWRRFAVETRHGFAFNTSSFSALLLIIMNTYVCATVLANLLDIFCRLFSFSLTTTTKKTDSIGKRSSVMASLLKNKIICL